MVLERDRVDDLDSAGSRQRADNDTVYRLVVVFEGMKNEFGVREVGEMKGWA
jgi:hypothetical protein